MPLFLTATTRYPFKLRTLLKNIIIASASVGAAFDPSSSFKTMMKAALAAPLLLVSSSHRAEGNTSRSRPTPLSQHFTAPIHQHVTHSPSLLQCSNLS
jgi:hypothetical protein